MIKLKFEDVGGCTCATSAVPSKTTYGNKSKNEIYYFGTPPKKPETLSNYLKKVGKRGTTKNS
jgi:hypothetical protein